MRRTKWAVAEWSKVLVSDFLKNFIDSDENMFCIVFGNHDSNLWRRTWQTQNHSCMKFTHEVSADGDVLECHNNAMSSAGI